MDTVLNLGLNDASVLVLDEQTHNPRFAWDSYRRFIAMFGDVVMGVPHELFEKALGDLKDRYGVKVDTQLEVVHLKELVEVFKGVVRGATKGEVKRVWFNMFKSLCVLLFYIKDVYR